jgi:hypothetical protein
MVDSKALARSAALAASILAALAVGGPAAGLTIDQTSDIAAGMAAFGPPTPLLTWSNLVPAVAMTGVDPGTGTVATALPGSGLFVKDWISGQGFETAELGVDGPENFELSFATSVRKLGLTVSTGRAGAQFQLTTRCHERSALSRPGLGGANASHACRSPRYPRVRFGFRRCPQNRRRRRRSATR